MSAALQFLQLYAIGAEPFTVWMLTCQLLLYITVVIYLALQSVDEEYLARLQPALLSYLRRVYIYHADLRCHHHHAILGYGVAGRAQTVTIEHTSGKSAVTEQQCSGTVPRLHQYGVILIECLQVFAYGVLVVETLRHQYAHGMRE